jgi:CheY-like chemotaxis protein
MKALRKAAVKPSRANPVKRILPLENCHFLLVEESADQRRHSMQLLEDAGAEVTLERHALTGVIVAVSMPERFDALILDVKLPLLEIVEAGVALRSAGFDRPIIAMVPAGNGKAKRTLHDAGCNIIQTNDKINAAFVGMVADFIHSNAAALN